MSTKKGEPRDVFERIEEQDAEDDVNRILAMDDAELDRELAAGGFDPAAVREKGRALGESLMRAARRARLVKTAKVGGVVVAVVAVAVGAAWLLRPPRATLPIGPEPPAPSAVPKPDAAPWAPAASVPEDDELRAKPKP
jgi:alkylation response protein AidB-like acyl-CoA dehydrogenase